MKNNHNFLYVYERSSSAYTLVAIFSTLSKPTIGQNRRLKRKTNSLR
jgi:hypothetical protein